MGRLSRRFGADRPAALAATLVVALASPALTALPSPAAAASWIAPVPARKPEAPPLPGTTPPSGLAVPAPPGVLDRSAPAAADGAVRGGTMPIPGPPPDFANTPLPIPDDPLADGPLPLPPASTQGTVALLALPPDPGPGREADLPDGNEFRIVFDEDGMDLEPAERELLTGIAARMARNQNARLQIRSYASAPDAPEMEARRRSLRRAVDLRRLLVDQGVRSTRIDVRALGTAEAGPADRVDLVLVNQ
jgi:outer membrane protein OmpA-like peptidoglycan-associated protein